MNRKQDDFEKTDLLEFARHCNLGRKKAMEIVDKTIAAFAGFEKLAREVDVSRNLLKTVKNNLRLDLTT